ncbi:MAG: DNA-3-methyladenine glycosylase 2 family protein [Betaproteobacteria bacterium]|nr:MAG: DNA-3-methyladenine glycosylase 2 family protein [Betaproteobacteria bacterium]
MELDARRCYSALKARDARFDGRFFVAVSTTGIYCRPVCTARTPGQDRCSFFANAASAERAGFRPCLRCRPELAPGHAPTDAVRTAAHWAVARIDAGALNEGDLERLAAEYGISSRQLRRVVETEFGVTPVELAQTRRLLLAKHLLTDSALGMTELAYASGFSSVRRFNHLFKTRYGLNPTALRRRGGPAALGDAITLKLAYRPPLDWTRLLAFLASRGAAGVECAAGRRYLRTASIAVAGKTHRGWIAAEPLPQQHALRLEISPLLMPALAPLLARARRLFDLDANPRVIEEHLGRDERLRNIVRRQTGLRVPGAFDGFELALRAVLGQQISVKAASTLFSRCAAAFGEPVSVVSDVARSAAMPDARLQLYAPMAERLAGAHLRELIAIGLTRKRAETLRALARAVTEDGLVLEPGADVEATMRSLQALPGIGAWTAHYIAMRALGYPDAYPHADLGLMKALGLRKAGDMLAAAEPWRPWRAYAAHHLWASLK